MLHFSGWRSHLFVITQVHSISVVVVREDNWHALRDAYWLQVPHRAGEVAQSAPACFCVVLCVLPLLLLPYCRR